MNVYILWQKADFLDEQDTLIAVYTKEGLEKAKKTKFLDLAIKHIKSVISINQINIGAYHREREANIADEKATLKKIQSLSDKLSGEYKKLTKERKSYLDGIDYCNRQIKNCQLNISKVQGLSDEEKVDYYFKEMNYYIEEEEVIE